MSDNKQNPPEPQQIAGSDPDPLPKKGRAVRLVSRGDNRGRRAQGGSGVVEGSGAGAGGGGNPEDFDSDQAGGGSTTQVPALPDRKRGTLERPKS